METTVTSSHISQKQFEMARQLALSEPREIYDLWRLSVKEFDPVRPLSEYCADATRHLIRYRRLILTDDRRKAFDEVLNIARQTSARSVINGQLVGSCGMEILIAAREAMQIIFGKYFDSSLIVYEMVCTPIRSKVEDQPPFVSFTEIGLDTGPLNRVYEIVKLALLQHFGEPIDERLESSIKGNIEHDPAYRSFKQALNRKLGKNRATGNRSALETVSRGTSLKNNAVPDSKNYLKSIYFTKDYQGHEMIRTIRNQIHERLGGLNFEKLLSELQLDFSIVRKELDLNVVPRRRRDTSTPFWLRLARRDNCVRLLADSEVMPPGQSGSQPTKTGTRKAAGRGRKQLNTTGDKRVFEAWITRQYPTFNELAAEFEITEREARNRVRRFRARVRYKSGK